MAPREDVMPNDDVMPLVVALRVDWATLAVSAAECSDWSPLSSCSSVGAWLSIFWKKDRFMLIVVVVMSGGVQ